MVNSQFEIMCYGWTQKLRSNGIHVYVNVEKVVNQLYCILVSAFTQRIITVVIIRVGLTLMSISTVKMAVNTLLAVARNKRSLLVGGIFGRSIANVIQLSAINSRTTLSNHFCSTNHVQSSRNLLSMKRKCKK